MTPTRATVLLLLAVAAQSTLPRVAVWFSGLDFVLLAVVAVALRAGPAAGVVSGTVVGLIQDAFGTGLLGIGGLAKTLAGFAAGAVAGQFMMGSPLARLTLYLGASLLHAVVVAVFVRLTSGTTVTLAVTQAIAEALGTAAAGVTCEQVAEWWRLTRLRRARRRGMHD
jgi:rod shape-determining protein MreD